MITHINIECIYPHPENPRKDIGDISELAESIKKNGIMQNLTVIPGHWENEEWKEEGYTLIIGHRRCAAAKAAGITEVPCKIAEGMSRKEQISTMLEENMQRNDLTIYEQAQGFQLMLDLGETETTIAEKTGFSRTTIRHRLNIAKLDSEEVKKKEQDDSFQLTLKDLYELEKVKSVEKRNEILKGASSSRDITWKVQTVVQQEKRDEVAAVVLKLLEDIGIPKAPKKAENEVYSGKWETVKEISLIMEPPETIEFADMEGLCYLKQYSSIRVMKKARKQEREKTEAELKREQVEQNRKQIKAFLKEMKEERRDFVLSIICGEITPLKEDIRDEVWNFLTEAETGLWESSLITAWSGKESWKMTDDEKQECKKEMGELSVIHQMLLYLHETMDKEIQEYSGCYKESAGNIYKKGYEILKKYGWSFRTKEQEQIIDGSSDLYERSN